MLTRLGDQIVTCREEAALAQLKAMTASTPRMRREYRRLEKHWLQLADSLDFATKISGYLQWTSQRLEPP